MRIIPLLTLPILLAISGSLAKTAAGPVQGGDAEHSTIDLSDDEPEPLIGRHFLDVQEPDPKGRIHKLSDYAGRGKWVLVDFWASWCGPCWAEMPNVTAAYKKYHDKGFEVVGFSFDDDKQDWMDAIEEWDMPWFHLSDLKYWQSEAGRVYGIRAIPDNILIDPDGIIVARGLRGEKLDEFLSEIFP